MGLGQIAFAKALEVDQSLLAKWENGKRPVPLAVLLRLADVVPSDEKAVWLKMCGAPMKEETDGLTVVIPVLRDAAAAGNPIVVSEARKNSPLVLPRSLIQGNNLCAIPVRGTSMEPMLYEGFLAIVDLSQRAATELVNKMVLARIDDGVTIKVLQRSRSGSNLLMPLNVNADNLPMELPGERGAILGRIVKWIGEPPPVRK